MSLHFTTLLNDSFTWLATSSSAKTSKKACSSFPSLIITVEEQTRMTDREGVLISPVLTDRSWPSPLVSTLSPQPNVPARQWPHPSVLSACTRQWDFSNRNPARVGRRPEWIKEMYALRVDWRLDVWFAPDRNTSLLTRFQLRHELYGLVANTTW